MYYLITAMGFAMAGLFVGALLSSHKINILQSQVDGRCSQCGLINLRDNLIKDLQERLKKEQCSKAAYQRDEQKYRLLYWAEIAKHQEVAHDIDRLPTVEGA